MSDEQDIIADLHPDPELVAELEAVTEELGLAVAKACCDAVMAGTAHLIRARAVDRASAVAAAIGVTSAAALRALHGLLVQLTGEDADEILSRGVAMAIAAAKGREPGADA